MAIKNVTKLSRLDYFLLSEDIMAMVSKCNTGTSCKSGHSIVLLETAVDHAKRGPGY